MVVANARKSEYINVPSVFGSVKKFMKLPIPGLPLASVKAYFTMTISGMITNTRRYSA
jgi:hypothetical protein